MADLYPKPPSVSSEPVNTWPAGVTMGINVKEFTGIVGDNATDNYAGFTALLNWIGSEEYSLIIDRGDYVFGGNITFPANVELVFLNGAKFKPANGVTITINSKIKAGLYQIFGGAGTIAGLARVNEVYPQWWGAVGDGVANDTAAFQAARTVIINGGIINIPKPSASYLISGDVGFSTGTGLIIVKGNNAKFKRAATASSYDMFSYRDNMIIIGVELEGYVQSGTGYADVVPASSFGFRSRTGLKNVKFIDCKSHGFPYDGWYNDVAESNIELINCSGYDCYRNDFTAVNGQAVTIDGGEWGNDTVSIPGKVNTIDIEPGSGNHVDNVVVKNIKCYDILNFTGAAATVKKVDIDNIIFDGSKAGLSWFRVNEMNIGRVEYNNSAALIRANTGTPGVGKFSTIDVPTGKNLVVNPYNSVTGWTLYNSGGTSALNTSVADRKGVQVSATAGNTINYRQTITVTEGTTYSFGGLIKATTVAGSAMGIFLVVGASTYYLQVSAGETKRVAAAIKIPTGVTSVTFYFGSNTSLASDMVYTDLFFVEGLVGDYYVEPKIYMSSAPASGAWLKGDTVWNSDPDAAEYIGWVCVTAGTPGTWKGFGTIQT